ncbi:MAG: MFS transporter [Haloquadratum sp.]|jgi:MFS family permease|nr:MFS transporter [Haloquadratum sp.]
MRWPSSIADGLWIDVRRERDIVVLSVAMFTFSLAFQATSRYLPRYLSVLGAGAVVIGLFGSLSSLLAALYPYPGGVIADRVGSRRALTAFGVASTVGFLLWALAEPIGTLRLSGPAGPLVIPVGIFVGAVFVQAWRSLGLGATFAVVKQAVPPDRLASGFASTETVRRLAFLLGPVLAAAVLAMMTFTRGFVIILFAAATVAAVGTVAQHRLYDAADEPIGKPLQGLGQLRRDLRALPAALRTLLVADACVRFANGMVYVFFVIVVTEFLAVGLRLPAALGGRAIGPDPFFGLLLGVEMLIALAAMLPMAAVADRVGYKPVVAAGFAVYALFPVLLISAPADPLVLIALFAFSGLRFAGLPAHKAFIIAPARRGAGATTVGVYYLIRNLVTVPAAAVGGVLYALSPTVAFTAASVVGLVGTAIFLIAAPAPAPAG